jgi:gliding motility-associated protein GldL
MMKKLAIWSESDSGQRVINMIVCFGASVVLAGALFKIQHWPGASIMLIMGMSTEVVIFGIYGMLPPHKVYHWEKAYPNLDIAPHHDPDFAHHEGEDSHHVESGTVSQQLDKMMEEADISPVEIGKLGEGLKKFGSHVAAITNVSDAALATNEYSTKTKEVSEALDNMKNAYASANDAINGLSNAAEGTKEYNLELQSVTRNLAELNTMYETELQDSSNHMRLINEFSGKLSATMEGLTSATADTQRYKEEMSSLANNLSSLNAVYGKMLNAMNFSSND